MHRISAIALMVTLLASAVVRGESQPLVDYLDDLPECLLFHQQAWGELGVNCAAHAPGKQPMKLRIKDTDYARGVGTHASGEMVLGLEGQYDAFQAEVGVQWQDGAVGSVVFQVYVDDEKRFDSGIMRETDPPKPVDVSLAGAQEMRLAVTDASDGITCDCANWANARLVRSASPQPRNPLQTMDIAPFGRVVTWDPQRMDGARANRVQEYHAEDLFLETDLLPGTDGNYEVPIDSRGTGCIGLQWLERRQLREIVMELQAVPAGLSLDTVVIQAWQGESVNQGRWVPLEGKLELEGSSLVFRPDTRANRDLRNGSWMVRWILPKCEEPVNVRKLTAKSAALCGTTELRLELRKPLPGQTARIEVYNGEVVGSDASSERLTWDLQGPITLNLRYCKPRPWQAERTVLRVRLPSAAFGVAVDDVVRNGCVYAAESGLFVALNSEDVTLDGYLRSTQAKETVLERVRKMPDQTLAQAMEKTRNPVQDSGPIMLSLACDNRKFVVQREGAVEFEQDPDNPEIAQKPLQASCRMAPTFGTGGARFAGRHLAGGWLPQPVIVFEEDRISYTQTASVIPCDRSSVPGTPKWLDGKPLCVVEYRISNQGATPSNARLRLDFLADLQKGVAAQVRTASGGVVVEERGRLLAYLRPTAGSKLEMRTEGGAIEITGLIRDRGEASLYVYVPAWHMATGDAGLLRGGSDALSALRGYWTDVLADAMQVDLPDPLLTNAIRASQVHCLIAARNEENGARVAPWIASMHYGPLESESNSIIRGMLLMGHREFARRSLEFFIKHYSRAGFLTTGYTLMGHGWHLWSLGEYYALTRDREWMQKVAPEVDRACRWIVAQRAKTKKTDARGDKAPQYGLAPPGVQADWNAFSYYFSLNGYYYAGLRQAAEALNDISYPGADELLADAEEFRGEILRAYEWTQSRMPVVPLKDGSWVPGYPSQVYVPGRTNDFYPAEDGNRSWCYDVELGAHQIIPQGVLDPQCKQADWMLDHMEDVQFLSDGWFDYPAERSEKDWFNLGGFAKVQPYYCRNAEIYALRDDVKPFIRSYFNSLASLLNTETMSLWEHFHSSGAWNKTHETGYFLHQSRSMLVMERGEELWLAPLVTSNWLKDGQSIGVRNAPTAFGKVSYTIHSRTGSGYIDATIAPPARSAPSKVVLRLRHPEGRLMRSVMVNGKPHSDFDPKQEIIRLEPGSGTIRVRARYD